MASKPVDPQLASLADALNEMRDSWVQMSLLLKDLIAQDASPERDEVIAEVERCLARLRESERR